MTDNEIVKALECCSCAEDILVRGKTYKAKPLCDLFKDALDLINRQKAEIDKQDVEIMRLKHEVERLEYDNVHWNDWEVKCRAIKEFAERLKEKGNMSKDGIIVVDYQIDNLVKEMVGE